jgi:PAS domain-containing protein
VRLEAEIAERRRLEARWRESERELLETQHIASLGTWKWDVTPDEVSWSPGLFRILGYEPESDRPSRAAFLERVHADDRALLEDRIAALLRNRQPFALDHRTLLPDDSTGHVHNVARVESNEQGSPVRLRHPAGRHGAQEIGGGAPAQGLRRRVVDQRHWHHRSRGPSRRRHREEAGHRGAPGSGQPAHRRPGGLPEAVEKLLRKTHPDTKLISLTVHEDPDLARECLELGAGGYLLRGFAASELFDAIHGVMEGRAYVTPLPTGASEDAQGTRSGSLTPRQREVVALLAEGLSMKKPNVSVSLPGPSPSTSTAS